MQILSFTHVQRTHPQTYTHTQLYYRHLKQFVKLTKITKLSPEIVGKQEEK